MLTMLQSVCIHVDIDFCVIRILVEQCSFAHSLANFIILLWFICSILLSHNMQDSLIYISFFFSGKINWSIWYISESCNSVAKSCRSTSSNVQPDIDESTTGGFWWPTSKENSHVAYVDSWGEKYLCRRIMGQVDVKVQSDRNIYVFHFILCLWNLSIEESLFWLLTYTYMTGNLLRNPEKITPFCWCFHLEFTVIDSL